jgi:hypothetical protein
MSLFGPAAIPRASGHLTPETVNTGISAYPSDSQELSQKCVRLNVESFAGVPAPTLWPPPPPSGGGWVGSIRQLARWTWASSLLFAAPAGRRGESPQRHEDAKRPNSYRSDAAWRPEKQKRGRSPRNETSILPRPRAETQSLRVFAPLRFSPSSSVPAGHGVHRSFRPAREPPGRQMSTPRVKRQDPTPGWLGRSRACAARRSAHPSCRSSGRSGWRRHDRPDSDTLRAACQPAASPPRSRRPSPC